VEIGNGASVRIWVVSLRMDARWIWGSMKFYVRKRYGDGEGTARYRGEYGEGTGKGMKACHPRIPAYRGELGIRR